jgi:hypothetical protein
MIYYFSHFSHPKKEVDMGAKITIVNDNRDLIEQMMHENIVCLRSNGKLEESCLI